MFNKLTGVVLLVYFILLAGCSRSDNSELTKTQAEVEAARAEAAAANAELMKTQAEAEAARAEAAVANAELAKARAEAVVVASADTKTPSSVTVTNGLAPPAARSFGWDLEVTDSTGQVVRLKQAHFRFEVGRTFSETRINADGLPIHIGGLRGGETTLKWELIDTIEVDGSLFGGEEPDATVTLKDKTTVKGSIYTCPQLHGEAPFGDYKIWMQNTKRIVVLGPSK